MPRGLPVTARFSILSLFFFLLFTSNLIADPLPPLPPMPPAAPQPFVLPPAGWDPFPWEPKVLPPPVAPGEVEPPLFPEAAGPATPEWLEAPADVPGLDGAAQEGSSFFDGSVDLPHDAPVPREPDIFDEDFVLDDPDWLNDPAPAAPDAPAPNNVPAPVGPKGGIMFRLVKGGLALASITMTLDEFMIYSNNDNICWKEYHENMKSEMQNVIWAYNMEDPRAILGVLGVSIPPGMPLNYSEKLFCEMNWTTQIKDKIQRAGEAAEKKFNDRFRGQLPWGVENSCGGDIDGINLDAFVVKQASICAKLHPTLCGKRVPSGTELVSPKVWDPQVGPAKTSQQFCAENDLLPGVFFSMKSDTVAGGVTPNSCPCN